MEEIQVGEYCRTDKGIIFKIDEEKKNLDIVNFLDVEYGKIVKHSKNIIDIIELYDHVNHFPVFDIIEYENGKKELRLATGNILENKDIETILTHEQYENNCYRLTD